MKHSQLRSVAHSLAASLGGGVSLITGSYDLDLYGDAALSPGRELTIDLMNGKVMKGIPSPSLSVAVQRIPREFDRLCGAAGFSRDDCRVATACFYWDPRQSGFRLTIEDNSGQASETEYTGSPAKRVLERDDKGRVRRVPIRRLK
jgi:hypothetical protein